ncbi:MAG TPA: hypothetical protein VFR24_08875, partial [Candidatus Angelobacter sp.]|nr:hypothetical protein [Candidatus Angelobacter sp.]
TLHTEPLLYESGPLFIECWFMNGYRSHLRCRPLSGMMLKKSRVDGKSRNQNLTSLELHFVPERLNFGHGKQSG